MDKVTRNVEYDKVSSVDELNEDGSSAVSGGSPYRKTETKDVTFADTRGNKLVHSEFDTYNTNVAGEHAWNEEFSTGDTVTCRNGASVPNPKAVYEKMNGGFGFIARHGLLDWFNLSGKEQDFKQPNPIAQACTSAAATSQGIKKSPSGKE